MKRAMVVMMALAALPLFAEQKTAPPPGPERPVHFPKVDERKLDNGLTVILVPMPNVPKITAELTILAGRGTDAKLHAGIAQLAARVANEGTATRSSKEIKDELRSIGGSLSLSVDADATQVSAQSLSEFAPKLFDLMSDVARHPAFPADELALGKANAIAEIEEERATPDFLASEQLLKAMYGSDPYSFLVASPNAINALTREQLKTFVSTYWVPNNAALIVLGDFEEEKTFAEVKKAFGGWTKKALPLATPHALPKRDKRQIYFIDRPGSVQSTILIGASAPPRKAAEYVPLRTANLIFGGAFYSRLTRNIREAKGYTYSPFSVADLRRRAGVFEAGASVRNEVTGPTILEMLYELDRMRVLPVTDEELADAKAYGNGILARELESQSGLGSRIATFYTFDMPLDFLQTFVAKSNAVTVADVRSVASKYFDTYRSAIVVVGDYAQVKDQVAPFGEVTLIKSAQRVQ